MERIGKRQVSNSAYSEIRFKRISKVSNYWMGETEGNPSVYKIKTAIRNKHFGYFDSIGSLVVLQNCRYNSGQCQGTSIESVGELILSLWVLIPQL
jgi:hypothetical protein